MSTITDALVLSIIQGCQSYNGRIVPHDLAGFVAHVVEKQQSSVTNMGSKSQNTNHYAIQQQSITLLCCDEYSPLMEAIKMQLCSDVYCLEYSAALQSRYIEKKLAMMEQTMSLILRMIQRCCCIVDSTGNRNNSNSVLLTADTTHPLDQATTLRHIYREIFIFVVKFSRVGCTSSRNDTIKLQAFRDETGRAMKSVFPASNMQTFIMKAPEEQRIYLQQLPQLVLGIILVGAMKKKGGIQKIGMRAIMDKFHLEQWVPTFILSTANDVESLGEVIRKYECFLLDGNNSSLLDCNAAAPGAVPSTTTGMPTLALHELIFYRQLQRYVKNVQSSVSTLHENLKERTHVFHIEVSDIGGPPTKQIAKCSKPLVSAKYKLIGNLWMNIDEAYAMIDSYVSIYKNLTDFRLKINDRFGEEQLKKHHTEEETTVCYDAQDHSSNKKALRVSNTGQIFDFPKGDEDNHDEEAEVLHIDMSTSHPDEYLMDLKLEFNGFCPWTLAYHGGFLAQGDLQYGGVVRYQKKQYSFADETARLSFMNSPRHILQMVESVIIQIPSLIRLLDESEWLPRYAHLRRDTYELSRAESPVKKDVPTSTPVHFVDSNIDQNYAWNEWDLRSRAILIANSSRLTVIATQTS